MRATAALGRGASIAAVLASLSLLTHRPEFLVLAAPFAIGSVIGGLRRSPSLPIVTLEVAQGTVDERQPIHAALRLVASEDWEVVDWRVGLDRLTTAVGSASSGRIVLGANEPRTIELELAADRFGRSSIGPVDVLAYGPGLTRVVSYRAATMQAIAVLPLGERFRAGEASPHALAFTGDHRSRSQGSGVDFAAIRPFAFGDPLRRVNWRATLKSGELHIAAVHAERTTEVVVVVDSARDAGNPGDSSLDLATRAAASIVEHYLGRGDIVRLVELGGRERTFVPRGGRRATEQVRQWLSEIEASGGNLGHGAGLTGLAGRSARAIVIVLSPLLDDEAIAGLATLRRRGASIVVLDMLRSSMLPEPTDSAERIARSLVAIEREMLIARLGALGVPVVPWVGTGSLDVILGDLARMAAAPRLTIR